MSQSEFSNAQKPRIAIAGATGRVGAELISLLSHDPVELVALTRQPAAARFPDGVTVTGVDFESHEALLAALRGVDRVFIAQGTSARQVDNEIALIDAAVVAGVRHIVKLSALGPASRLVPFAWHMQIEAHLSRQPVASTVLRPSAFTYLLKRAAAEITAGSWGGAAGEGRVNFIDTRDVAAAARVALLEDVDPDSQRAYHLTGSPHRSMAQIAEELTRLRGEPVTYIQRTPAQQREALSAAQLPPFVVDLLAGLDQVFRESVLGETTTTVETLTGKAPRSLTEWLNDNLAIFKA